MDSKTNGCQETTQGAENQTQEQQQEDAQAQQEVTGYAGVDWEKQIANREARIAELERQVAEAAKNAETAETLRGEIAELEVQVESDWIDFKLQLAGVRNVKDARAILGNHDNDIEKLSLGSSRTTARLCLSVSLLRRSQLCCRYFE